MRSDGREFPKDRCLVPLDGFYEYTAPDDPKQKRKACWLFRPAAGQEFAIAGLLRPHPQVGEAFTLLTAPPGPDVERLHNRQIVLLRPDQWRSWLDGSAKSVDMLQPTIAGSLDVAAA
jgi:putative SOS response-associated peptidase YedK